MKAAALVLIFLVPLLCGPAFSGEIHDAARRGDIDTVGLLLEGDPMLVNSLDERNLTPLTVAAAAGQADIVGLLLDRGALVNATNDRDASTLHFAASRGDTLIVRMLIEHGAVVNARAIGCATPLCWASSAGRTRAAEVLLAYGANVNAECVDLWTPLYRAASSGNLALVELLMEHGASVNMQCVEGRSPLHNAVEGGHEDVVNVLLGSGSQIDTRDALGKTPLWVAVERGHTRIAETLLAQGARIYANEHESDQTALHQAAIRGYGDMVKVLLDAGADTDARDGDGNLAEGLASRYGHREVAEMLFPRRFSADRPAMRQEEVSHLRRSLKRGEAVIWYLGGYGVAVKTRSHLLVLDYSEPGLPPDEPSLSNGRLDPAELSGLDVLAVVPGLRTGYPIRAIMEMHEMVPEMKYVLGFRTDRGPEHVYVEPMGSREVNGMSMASTAPNRYARGQEFLITADGVTLYKGFSWNYWDDESSLVYRDGIEYLGGRADGCDIAFVPCGSATQEALDVVLSDILHMCEELRPKVVFCVGDAWQYVRDFAREAEARGLPGPVVFAKYPGDCFLYTEEGLKRLK